ASGDLAGLLTHASNDPDEPIVTVPLQAHAAGAPRLEVDPGVVQMSTPGDAPVSAPLTLRNTGASPLSFSLRAAVGTGAQDLSQFETLPASPVPLTAVVGDPATGFLYAQENHGKRFFRYEAATGA